MTLLAGVAHYAVFFAVFTLYYALLTLGLNLQWGFTGLFNVGVAGFVLVGAYGSAIVTSPPHADQLGGFGLPVPLGWLAAALAAGGLAWLVGRPALRLRQDYLAITTFGIAVVLQLVALNARRLTGGPFGYSFIPRPLSATIGDPVRWNLAYLALVLLLVLAVHAGSQLLVQGPWGRVLRAIREDERAAMALGKDSLRCRLEAFVLGAMVMGLGGAVYAHFIGFIAPEDFQSLLTFQVWTMLIVGGSGNNGGAIIGAIVVWGLWTLSGAALDLFVPAELKARAAALQIVLIGTGLVLVLLFRPRGILGERVVVSRHAGPPASGRGRDRQNRLR